MYAHSMDLRSEATCGRLVIRLLCYSEKRGDGSYQNSRSHSPHTMMPPHRCTADRTTYTRTHTRTLHRSLLFKATRATSTALPKPKHPHYYPALPYTLHRTLTSTRSRDQGPCGSRVCLRRPVAWSISIFHWILSSGSDVMRASDTRARPVR